jgi:UDP-2,3-diacylglucosamine hydrolase
MILFISDLHLDPKRPAITQAFFDFLDSTAQTAKSLYLLGDIFEAWLGDDDDTPAYREIIQHIRAYVDQGHHVYFMHGNRDFLIGEQFAQDTGVTLLADPTVIECYNQRYLLMHGDSLCTKDADYMAFRQMVRSPQWQQSILACTLEQRREYAHKARQQSSSMTSMKAEDILDVTPEDVVQAMTEHQVQHFIHGHTHRPNVHTLTIDQQKATRYVLGDWGEQAWYIRIDETGIKLHSYTL